MDRYKDPNDEGNSEKYHTGKPCITSGCSEPAGTAWGPMWCFKHNVERMIKIDDQFDSLDNSFREI